MVAAAVCAGGGRTKPPHTAVLGGIAALGVATLPPVVVTDGAEARLLATVDGAASLSRLGALAIGSGALAPALALALARDASPAVSTRNANAPIATTMRKSAIASHAPRFDHAVATSAPCAAVTVGVGRGVASIAIRDVLIGSDAYAPESANPPPDTASASRAPFGSSVD